MRVSYLTDPQVREEYLRLLTRLDDYIQEAHLRGDIEGPKEFWNELGYSNGEIPDY